MPDSELEGSLRPPLKLDKTFQPCPVADGEEVYRNGIFLFNISRILAHLDAHANEFPVKLVALTDIQNYGDVNLDEDTIRSADLSCPVLFAEIAPGRYNLIDGNHRVAKARRVGAPTVAARSIGCPHHVAFLTTFLGYGKYVEYWNSKLEELSPAKAPRKPRKRVA